MNEVSGILIKEKSSKGVLRLTMNNLDQKNALSETMISILKDELEDASTDQSIRVIVLAANGNVFCSGHDLKEITSARENQDNGHAFFQRLFDHCSTLMQLIVNSPQPVIAEVDGIATAAGCQLVASCDLAVADESARFGVNGVNIGLFCSTPMVALTRAVGRKKAFEMLVTGQFIEAKEAKEIGLINKVSKIGKLEETADELALQIASKLGDAVKIGKEAFYKQAEMSINDAYSYTGAVMAENMMFEQTKKGINLFLDKKIPEWDQ